MRERLLYAITECRIIDTDYQPDEYEEREQYYDDQSDYTDDDDQW